MATVRLGRYELEEYDLPRVCMRCGARASHYRSKKFQWFPPWAWLVLGWLGAMMFMKTATVPVPLCDRHKWHWGLRTALVIAVLVGIFALMFGGVALAEVVRIDPPVVFIPVGVLFLGWIVLAVVVAATSIRPAEITDKSITLRGVSPEFVEALEEQRRGHDDEDRPRRRPRYDDDDEDDRPRRNRRAADDGGYYDPGRGRRRPPSDAYEDGDDRR